MVRPAVQTNLSGSPQRSVRSQACKAMVSVKYRADVRREYLNLLSRIPTRPAWKTSVAKKLMHITVIDRIINTFWNLGEKKGRLVTGNWEFGLHENDELKLWNEFGKFRTRVE